MRQDTAPQTVVQLSNRQWMEIVWAGTQMSDILSNSSSCPRKPNTVAQVFLTETSKFNALDTKCTGNSQTIETVCAGTLSNSSSWPRKTNRVVQVFQTCDFNASDINVRDIVKLADLHSQKVSESQTRNVNVPDTDFLRSYQNHALVQCPLVLCQMSPINPVKRTFFYFIRLQF